LKAIRYLIFDLDGTLIDSSDGVVDAVNYSLRRMGADEQPPDRIKSYIGYPLSQMYPVFTDAPVAELYAHFRVRAADTVVASSVALEGVDQTLRELRRSGYQMAVASTKVREHIEGIVAKLGWGDHFRILIGGDEVDRVKPDPEMFRVALTRLSATAGESLVVGDTINDILAARAVPMKAVAVNSPYGGREQLQASEPDHFIERITDLPALLINHEK
jgi:HAD superfamily hydrolase (TIGR01509 family)